MSAPIDKPSSDRSHLRLLHRVASRIAGNLELTATLEGIVANTARELGVPECHLFLIEDGRVNAAVSHGVDSPLPAHDFEELTAGISGWVLEHGVGAVSANTVDDPRNTGPALARAQEVGPRSAVVVPISTGSAVLGTLTLLAEAGRLTEHTVDLELVEMIATHAAAAIVNARLLEQARDHNRELRELGEARERFMSTVAHELRNAVSAANLAVHLLGERPAGTADEATAELIDLAVSGVDDAAAIVSGLLGYGPAATHVSPQRIDLVAIARTAARATRTPIEAPPGRVEVTADPIRVRQIVRNLLDNAERYGGTHRLVAVRREQERGIIAVVDDGSGVEATVADSLFEPYATSGREIGGRPSLGLGLSVSRDLARAMGGDLSYHRTGALTEFRLTL